MADKASAKYPRHETRFVTRPNENDLRMRWDTADQKARSLKCLNELTTRLQDLLHNEHRSKNIPQCEKYLEILVRLNGVLSKTNNEKIYKKCAEVLSDVTEKIPELEGYVPLRNRNRHSNSPDSTGVFVDHTLDKRTHSLNNPTRSGFKESQVIPDSTVNDGIHNRLNGFNQIIDLNDIESEVTSSGNGYKMKNSSYPIPETTYPSAPITLFSRRRGDGVRHPVEHNTSKSLVDRTNDPVKLIMQVAKTTVNNANKTENSNETMKSSPTNDIGSIENEQRLNNALSNIYTIDDKDIEAFSRNSLLTDEIERYEDSLKSKFFDRESEVVEIDDVPTPPSNTSPVKNRPFLSSMLQNMMVSEETPIENRDHSDDPCSRRSSSANSNRGSNEPSPVGLPNSNNTNSSLFTKNSNNVSKEKTEAHVSARKKLLQEIEVVHRVGESGKINPSLKQLRSDVKKPTGANISTPPEVTLSQPSTPCEKEGSVDRGSSMSISPADRGDRSSPSPRISNEISDVKKSSDQHSRGGRTPSRGRSPARNIAARDKTNSSAKPSHSYQDSYSNRMSRYDYKHRDEPKTRFSSSGNRSPKSSGSSFHPRDRRESKDYSSDSSKSYDSSRDDGSKRDKSHKFDGNFKRRPRSRSRGRYRGGFTSSNPYKIDRRSPSSKREVGNPDHSFSFQSFVNNIGGGRTADDELTKNDVASKTCNDEKRNAENPADKTASEKDSKPIIKPFKKLNLKFKLDTNFSNKLNFKNESDKKVPETVAPDEDVGPSPIRDVSPIPISGSNTPDISTETRPQFPEQSFRVNNTVNTVPKDPRRPVENNFSKRYERFPKVSGADPRLKQTSKLSKLNDPRLKKSEQMRNVSDPAPGFARNDPRKSVGVTSSWENNPTRTPFMPSRNKPNEYRPPNASDNFDSTENDTSKHQTSFSKPRPNNITIDCDNSVSGESSYRPNKFKSKFVPSFGNKPSKPAPSKPLNSETLKETVKKQTTFYSPIADAHPDIERAQTGRGYGVQKPKKDFRKYTIPKIKKSAAVDDRENEKGRNATTNDGNSNDDVTSVLERGSSFQDHGTKTAGSSAERKSSREYGAKKVSSAEKGELLPHKSSSKDTLAEEESLANVADEAGTSGENNAKGASREISFNNNANKTSSEKFHDNSASRKEDEPCRNDDVNQFPANDDEECWDPEDSPVMVIAEDVPIDDSDDEPIIISETSNANPEVIDISSGPNQQDSNSAEIVENGEKNIGIEVHAARNDSPDRHSDIIEIHDSDDVDKIRTPPREKSPEKSPNMKIQNVYSLDGVANSSQNIIEKATPDPSQSNEDKLKAVEISDFLGTPKRLHLVDTETDELVTSLSIDSDFGVIQDSKPKRKRKRGQRKRKKKPDRNLEAAADAMTKKLIDGKVIALVANDDISTDTVTEGDTVHQSSASTDQDSSKSDDKLKRLIVDYLKAHPDFSGKIDEDEKINAADLVFKIFPCLTPEMFTHIQSLKSNYESNPNVDRVSSNVDHSSKTPSAETDELPPTTSNTVTSKPSDGSNQTDEKAADNKLDNPPVVKKLNRELNSLHVDLQKLVHTKNNIFSIGGTRSCRLQSTNYNDRTTRETSKNKSSTARGKKVNNDLASSDSENENRTRVGVRRGKNIAGLDSDSESTRGSARSSVVIRKTNRVKSKAFVSDDSDDDSDINHKPATKNMNRAKSKPFISGDDDDDDDDDESDTYRVIATKNKNVEISEIAHDDISKCKPCPRSVKMGLFGAEYENFEKIESQKHPWKWPEQSHHSRAIVILPLLPVTCDDLSTCICKTRIGSFVSKNEVGTQQSVSKYKKNAKKRKFAESEDDAEMRTEKKVSPLKIKRTRKAGRGAKASGSKNLGHLGKLRLAMSKTIGTKTWSQKKEKKNEETKKTAEFNSLKDTKSTPSSNAKTSQIHCQQSAVKAEEKIKVVEDDSNDDLEVFPVYNAFKDPNVKEIKIATIGVKEFEPGLVYTCNTNFCNNYETQEVKMMSMHLNFLHNNVKCNGTCSLCANDQKYPSLKAAFLHFLHEHLTAAPDQQEQMDFPRVRVKDEPMDEEPTNVDDQLFEDDFVPEITPTVFLPESFPVTVPAESTHQPTVVSISTSENVPKSPIQTPSVTKPNKPILRVRRFSGDKLSGTGQPAQPAENQGVAEQLQNNKQAISDAQSLGFANNKTDIPPSQTPVPRSDDVLNMAQDFGPIVDDLTSSDIHLMHLYKCSGDKCEFSTDHEKEFIAHLNSAHRINVKRSKKIELSCLICAYCKEKFNTPEMLANHLRKYKGCKFQCAYCVFRASRPILLEWHQDIFHQTEPPRILVPDFDDNKTEILTLCETEKKDLKEVVLPFSCVHCNIFQTISVEEYKDHWKRNHSQTNIWPCQQCESQSFSPDLHMKHLTLHGLGEYQCVYCITGASSEEAIRMHLMTTHRTLYPKVVKRIASADTRRVDIFDNSIQELDWDESADNFKDRLKAVNKNRISAVTLYKDTSNENSSTADASESATAIYVLNKDMEYVLDSEATKKFERTSGPRTRANVNKTQNAENANDAVIAVDSSDDEGNDRLVICEDMPSIVEPPEVSKNAQAKPVFATGLSGVDLYKCGFSGCAAAFEDFHSFKVHLSTCDNARSRTSPRCPHCNRNFLQNAKFLGHMALHSVPRYLCTICEARFTNARKAEDHLKQVHKVPYSKVIPANPLKSNFHQDLFIAVPNREKGVKSPNKQCKKLYNAKYIASMNSKPKEADTAKHITKVYSYEEVEKNLPMQLFSEPVTCGICSTYNSKVRTNIINHLKCHSTGLVPQKDITNPVPCMEKSELMFNKMTNHAAFSSKTDDKKIKCLIEKVEAYSGDKNEIIPGFVPKTLRFSCNAPDCRYISTDANRLKSHWETLHSDLNFSCGHCGVIIPVEKVPTHLRYHDGRLFKCYYCNKVHYQRQALERHQQENHSNSPPSIQVIRDLSPEEVEELSRDARFNYDKSSNHVVGKFVKVSQWKCNLCKCPPTITEDSIKSHCISCHRISTRHKCCLCIFGDDNKDEVISHMREKHESVSQVIVTIYSELHDGEENSQSSTEIIYSGGSQNLPNATPSTSRDARGQHGAANGAQNKALQDQTQHNQQPNLTLSEDSSQNGNINNLFILPLPNNRYKCPYCNTFTSESREIITDHLYQEKNYMKYVCMTCGITGATEHEILKHTKAEHTEENIAKLTEDEDIENQIEEILNYQQNKFSQVNKESSDSIMIVDSEDENSANELANLIEKMRSSKSNPREFVCPHCPKKCSSSSGLKNHMTVKHKSKNPSSASNADKKSKMPNSTVKVTSVSLPPSNSTGQKVYPCPFCDMEFANSNILFKHLCECPKYKSKGVVSPIKWFESKPPSNDELFTCFRCGKKCSPNEAAEHNANCKSQSKTLGEEKKKCVLCAFEGDAKSMVKHTKAEHEPMECLNCNKILIGTKELEHHVRLSVININGSDEGCVPQEKDVVFMCPYCPIGLRGQTYDKYMYVSNHMETKHPPSQTPRNMMVKINNSSRELLEIEVAYMQNKFNNEQSRSTSLTVSSKKKRNVAVKSTTRISATSVASDSRAVTASKIQRVDGSFDASNEYSSSSYIPTPKFNIFHGRKADYDSRRT